MEMARSQRSYLAQVDLQVLAECVVLQMVQQLLERLQRERDHVADFGAEMMQRYGTRVGQQRAHGRYRVSAATARGTVMSCVRLVVVTQPRSAVTLALQKSRNPDHYPNTPIRPDQNKR